LRHISRAWQKPQGTLTGMRRTPAPDEGMLMREKDENRAVVVRREP